MMLDGIEVDQSCHLMGFDGINMDKLVFFFVGCAMGIFHQQYDLGAPENWALI